MRCPFGDTFIFRRKKMKRNLAIILLSIATVICLSLCLAACDDNGNGNGESWSIDRVYVIAQENGFDGSLDDFIAMFKGEQGEQGIQGEQGEQGEKGEKGEKGPDGIGIKSAYLNEYEHLILVLTDDTEIDAGKIKIETPETPFTAGLSYQATTRMGEKSYLVSGVGLVAEYDVVIPATFNGCPVVGIMDNAFKNNTFIRSVTIPNSITDIGSFAFAGCSNLRSVDVGNGTHHIGVDAFSDCNGLEELNIHDIASWCDVILDNKKSNPLYYAQNLYFNGVLTNEIVIPENVSTISRYTFINGKSITSISIHDDVKDIEEYAFEGTSYLDNESNWKDGVLYIGKHLIKANNTIAEEFTVKDGTLTIAARAFQAVDNLVSVVIPGSIKRVSYLTFADCDRLTSVTINSGVEEIYICSFMGNPNLTTVNIPQSVISIGVWSFADCSLLTDIYYDGSKAQWNEIKLKKNWDCDYNDNEGYVQRSYIVHCKDGDIQV